MKVKNSKSAGSGVFARPGLARQLAAQLLGRDPLFNFGRSGLFLAGPRRTGKSTFLKHDLLPQLDELGGLPIYVDLWSVPGADPGDLIAEAVRDAMRKADTPLTKTGRALARIKKVHLKASIQSIFEAEFGIEIDTVGKKDGVSLAKAFKALNDHTGKPIALIIDEAQHALTSQAGADMLFALKAARDALNLKTPSQPRLAVLATGSVRAKISALVLKKGEAFYGAAVADFPSLDASFVNFVLLSRLASLRPEALPSKADAFKAFQLVGHRPEDLDLILQQWIISGKLSGEALIDFAKRRRTEMFNELKKQVAVLTPLQKAVLRRMAIEDAQFAPFTAEALAFYMKYCDKLAPSPKKLTAADVQRALDALERKHRLVWRSARGVYALDDHMIGDVLDEERMGEEIRLLTEPGSKELSVAELQERGFFRGVLDEE